MTELASELVAANIRLLPEDQYQVGCPRCSVWFDVTEDKRDGFVICICPSCGYRGYIHDDTWVDE